jgi:tetratricopeptide (TPR) repeat protein
LGEAYATRGFIRAKQWRWDEAEEHYIKAIEYNRDYALGRQWYSWYLRNVGDYNQSKYQIEYAYKLAYNDNDLLPIIHANVVIAYILKEDHLRAIEEGEKLVTRFPDFWQGYSWLGKAYQEQGNKSEALKNLSKAVEISKRSHTILANLGYAHASYGNTKEANSIIVELIGLYNNKKATGQSIAKIYHGLGNDEKAFEWLDKDMKAKSGDLPNISWHPAFKSLHGDTRFNRIVENVGLKQKSTSQ